MLLRHCNSVALNGEKWFEGAAGIFEDTLQVWSAVVNMVNIVH